MSEVCDNCQASLICVAGMIRGSTLCKKCKRYFVYPTINDGYNIFLFGKDFFYLGDKCRHVHKDLYEIQLLSDHRCPLCKEMKNGFRT